MESITTKRQRLVEGVVRGAAGGGAGGGASQRKRARKQAPAAACQLQDTATSGAQDLGQLGCCEYDVSLYVRWHSAEGGTRVNRLPLDPIASVGDLRGLFRRLIHGAFSSSPLPDYLTSPEFYKFTPAEDFITLPGDIARTQFRLVVTLGGWEYGVVDRELGVQPDPARNLLVTVAEFESDVFELDGQECVMNLIAYPTICVRRDFLDAAVRALLAVAEVGESPAPTPAPEVTAAAPGMEPLVCGGGAAQCPVDGADVPALPALSST